MIVGFPAELPPFPPTVAAMLMFRVPPHGALIEMHGRCLHGVVPRRFVCRWTLWQGHAGEEHAIRGVLTSDCPGQLHFTRQ